jgi:hypothetical protein
MIDEIINGSQNHKKMTGHYSKMADKNYKITEQCSKITEHYSKMVDKKHKIIERGSKIAKHCSKMAEHVATSIAT